MTTKTKKIGVVAITTLVVLFLLTLNATTASATAVSVDPASQTVQPGDTFDVDVRVDDVTFMGADQATLNFDSSAMQVTGVTEGDFLKTAGSTMGAGMEMIDNVNGEVTFFYTLIAQGVGVDGSGILATIHFQAEPAAEGTFPLELTDVILSDGNGNQIIVDDVNNGTVTISAPTPVLCTAPDPLDYNFGNVPEGETRDWTFDITNCGDPTTTLTWTVSDDQTWITMNPAGGTTTTETDTVTVTIDTTGLACGTTHTGTITVNSDGGTKTGTITVTVVSSIAPVLCTAPDPLDYNFGNVPEGETRDWTFDITNCGDPTTTLTWTVSDDQTWITMNPAGGTTTTETDTVTVTIDTTGLACGTTHTGTITVNSDGGTKTGTISVYVLTPTPVSVPGLNGISLGTAIGILAVVLAVSASGTKRRKKN